MPRIAIFSDIHGNVPALEAVLEDIARQDVDEVLVGGDLVGRGPQGSRVVKRLRGLGFPTIGGNHEEYLLTFRRGEIPADWRTTEELAAARWMAAELDDDDVDYISSLPFSLARPGLRLVHGSPSSNRQGIGPWTRDDDIERHLAQIAEGMLVCAHTHRPLVRQITRGQIVNVGSVGLPFNRDRRAQYALFSHAHDDDPWHVELRQVAYDCEQIFAIYRQTGFLAQGGVTARLLWLELEHATPLLVPFLEWAKASRITPTLAALDGFFKHYQPGDSLRDFFARLDELTAS